MKRRPEHHPLRGPLSIKDYWLNAAFIIAFVAVIVGLAVAALVR